LTAQQMLNIALADARLYVDPFIMQALVDNIERRVLDGHVALNDVDQRQWEEVKRWCMPCCQAMEVMDSFNTAYGGEYGGMPIPLLAPDGSMYPVPMFLPDEGFVGEQEMYEGFDMSEEYTTDYVHADGDGHDPADIVLDYMCPDAAAKDHVQDGNDDGYDGESEGVDDGASQGTYGTSQCVATVDELKQHDWSPALEYQ
ncbi:unnamed protein product, partial [Prorocentrum cordatum]